VLAEPVEGVDATQDGVGHSDVAVFVAFRQVVRDARDAVLAGEVEAFVGVDGDGDGRLSATIKQLFSPSLTHLREPTRVELFRVVPFWVSAYPFKTAYYTRILRTTKLVCL
jgi:hypothetical protein